MAGAISGLLIGLGALFLVRDEPAAAVAVWGVAAGVGGTIAVAGSYIRRAAAVTSELGQELADQAAAAQQQNAAHAHSLGELRTQLALLQRTVARLEQGETAPRAPTGRA